MRLDRIRKRAVELNRDHSAANVYRQLLKEFPGQKLPDEHTVLAWLDEAGAKALRERQELYLKEHLHTHYSQLTDIANMLLGNELGSVLSVQDGIYSIIEEGRWVDKDKSELTSMIESNIDYICSILPAWEFFDMFVAHLEHENEELKADFYKFVKQKPLEFVNLVRSVSQRKVFKGTCPICEKWL